MPRHSVRVIGCLPVTAAPDHEGSVRGGESWSRGRVGRGTDRRAACAGWFYRPAGGRQHFGGSCHPGGDAQRQDGRAAVAGRDHDRARRPVDRPRARREVEASDLRALPHDVRQEAGPYRARHRDDLPFQGRRERPRPRGARVRGRRRVPLRAAAGHRRGHRGGLGVRPAGRLDGVAREVPARLREPVPAVRDRHRRTGRVHAPGAVRRRRHLRADH